MITGHSVETRKFRGLRDHFRCRLSKTGTRDALSYQERRAFPIRCTSGECQWSYSKVFLLLISFGLCSPAIYSLCNMLAGFIPRGSVSNKTCEFVPICSESMYSQCHFPMFERARGGVLSQVRHCKFGSPKTVITTAGRFEAAKEYR